MSGGYIHGIERDPSRSVWPAGASSAVSIVLSVLVCARDAIGIADSGHSKGRICHSPAGYVGY